MSSAIKTLELLSYFSTSRPEIGLSQLCRLARRDKATTYRHLQALETAGFVEQNPVTRAYRLGPATLQLAQVREATVPRKAGVQMALARLSEVTGETAHATILSGKIVYGLSSCESPKHGARAVIDIATFPLHATASGLCALAFGPPDLMEMAAMDLKTFTSQTPISEAQLQKHVGAARACGFGHASSSFEAEIHGIAAPVFDQTGQFAGSVAVASVAARVTHNLETLIQTELVTAARAITHNWGGIVPPEIEAAWARTRSSSHALDHAS